MRLLISEAEEKTCGIVDEALFAVMEQAAELAVRGEGADPDRIEISLSFVSPEEIHALNRDYRGVDRVTDVLSFPLIEELEELIPADAKAPGPGGDGNQDGPADTDWDVPADEAWLAPLGDVVICLEKAQEQAEEFGHSREREIVYLFVHSVLHLLGYDHMEEDEKRQMRTREEELMRAIDLQREA